MSDDTVFVPARAVLFDMDGTLIDSNPAAERAWVRWAASVGLDPAPILAIHHGRRAVETLAAVAPQFNTREHVDAIHAASEDEISGVVEIPGAVALTRALPAGTWAVVTAATERIARQRLTHVGIDVTGVPLVTAERVTEGKPSPEGYRLAARLLGVDPSECVVFEDAPAGVAAGRDAGTTVIGMATTFPAGALDTPLCVRTLADVAVVPGGLRLTPAGG